MLQRRQQKEPTCANDGVQVDDIAVYRRAGILLVLCAALAAIASSTAVHEELLRALTMTEDVIGAHPIMGAAIFVLAAAVSAMLAFISIAMIVPAAVFAWGAPTSITLLWLGWILGGIGTYSIGRFVGRPVVRWLAAQDSLRKLESALPVDAPLWMIVLLQLALPSEIPGYVLGVLRYPLGRYATALALAELPYALAAVYLGASFIDGRSGVLLGAGILVALLSLAPMIFLRKAIRARSGRDRQKAQTGSSAGADDATQKGNRTALTHAE